MTVEADCEATVHAALDRWGRLDILVNNVGIGSSGTVVTEDVDRWERVMDVNLTSMVLASWHAIPAMISHSGGGAVVNISSISALRPRGMTAQQSGSCAPTKPATSRATRWSSTAA